MCMHGVASMTHEPGVLLSVLRQLSGTQAVALARYLLKLMTKYSGEPVLTDVITARLCDAPPPPLGTCS